MENNLTPKQALEKLKENEINIYYHLPWDILEEYYIIIDQALTEIEIQKQILEILKNKKVDVFMVDITNCVGEYNVLWKNEYQLTEEEYNLLKEWLKNGR